MPAAHEPRLAGQAAARGRGDVRRRGRAVRPDQHRAVLRAGPRLAAGHPGRASTCGRASACLDLGAGTGVSTEELARSGAYVVGADLSVGMLRVGPPGPARPCRCSPGDALALPFADGAFDAVTISFGLRNVVDTAGGAARAGPGDPARRPAGGLRVQRTRSTPPSGTVYLRLPDAGAAGGRPAGLVQPGRLRLPGRVDPRLARPGRAGRRHRGPAGWARVGWRNLTGGVVALHRATRANRRIRTRSGRAFSAACARTPRTTLDIDVAIDDVIAGRATARWSWRTGIWMVAGADPDCPVIGGQLIVALDGRRAGRSEHLDGAPARRGSGR